MKKILITGATGFLAEKIFDHLKTIKNYKVILAARNTEKLKQVLKYKKTEIRHFDLNDPSTFDISLKGIDSVIHLAAMDYPSCEAQPELAWHINVKQLEEFFLKSIDIGASQFLYFSTFHVYGANIEGTITEDRLAKPLNTYSKTHLAAENIILANKMIEGIVIRLSNSFGKPLFDDSKATNLAVNDICKQAIANKKITLKSSGKQLRDFVSANEVGKAVALLLEKNKTANFQNSIYNFGSGKSMSILEVANFIQNQCSTLLQFTPEIETQPQSEDNILKFKYSIDKIQKLGFEFSYSLEYEFKMTLNEFALISRLNRD